MRHDFPRLFNTQIRYAFAAAVLLTTAPVIDAALAQADVAPADQISGSRVKKLCNGPSADPATAQALCNQLYELENSLREKIKTAAAILSSRHADDEGRRRRCAEIFEKSAHNQTLNYIEERNLTGCQEIAEQELALAGTKKELEKLPATFDAAHEAEILVLEGVKPLPPPLSLTPPQYASNVEMPVRRQPPRPIMVPPPDPVAHAIGTAFRCVFSLFTACPSN